MNIELRDFQEEAVRQLFRYVRRAREEAREGDAQAILLAAPTGSGKTVTVTALMERIARGFEDQPGDPKAVFLWLSDSPELNAQSRDKIRHQSSVFRDHTLVLVDATFREERFTPGKVYFLNTQKLAKDTLLTRTGDNRQYTIWEVIENTAREAPGSFYLLIDEAHRGTNLSTSDRRNAETIVQKFVLGDPEVGLSPVPLILGISATPDRFRRLIQGATARVLREHKVESADVRASGLIKERIFVFVREEEETRAIEWPMLAQAGRRWRQFRDEWRRYCGEQGVRPVDPILVVQVEDASNGSVTRTDLGRAVQELEREMGTFGHGALAHAFEVDTPVPAGGYSLRKVAPSSIESDEVLRVVFFKTALSTGWDCPRAEVMMSFRRAVDPTYIAQLVGRMVRTPLARRVEGSELLNTVSLFLPYYNPSAVEAVKRALSEDENLPVEIETGGSITLRRNPELGECFALLETLPSYALERVPKTSNTRRLVKLGRLLTMHEIALDAWGESKALVVQTLWEELERVRGKESFRQAVRMGEEIRIRQVAVEYGEWREGAEGETIRIRATPEVIDDLFEAAGRMLGEGLHMEFWRQKSDPNNALHARLELYVLLQERAVWERLEKACGQRIEQLLADYRQAIRELPTSQQEEYHRIRRRAKDPQTVPLVLPQSIEVQPEGVRWLHHLYVDHEGGFGWNANTWEDAVLKAERSRPGFVGFLRNTPRKEWALRVPYELRGEIKPLFPDLIVFRRVGEQLVADLLDPHDPGLRDAVEKAHGLAAFAERHGDQFGRIELIMLDEHQTIRRLDVTRESVRGEVQQVRDNQHLERLFNLVDPRR